MINILIKTTIKTGINAFTNGILTKVILISHNLINHILINNISAKKNGCKIHSNKK